MWLPASITRTRSQSITVGILCAMLIMVQAAKSSRMIFWITASVWESTEAVASSMNSILLRFSITRPRHSSCRCPTLQFSPLSTTRWTKDKLCSLSVYSCNKCFKNSFGSMVLQGKTKPLQLCSCKLQTYSTIKSLFYTRLMWRTWILEVRTICRVEGYRKNEVSYYFHSILNN